MEGTNTRLVIASAAVSLVYCVGYRIYVAASKERSYWYKYNGETMRVRFVVAFHVVLFVLGLLSVLVGALR